MASDSTSVSDEQFIEIAISQGLLTKDQATKISQAAADSEASLPAICIEKGLLRPVQVDVIQGLAEADNLAPGYEVVDLLGYGGLGIVYRVRQPKLDRMVALKTIPIHRIENPSVIARFKQEAKAIGKLKHPNIVAAHDFGTHRDRLFLAMELVEGTDLDRLINSSEQISESVAWSLAQQTASGLAHAAQHNLVHRDIKPANLLLTKPLTGYPLPAGVPLLKITDFGLVQLESQEVEGTRLTMGGTSLGTPHYMAPEQIADAHVDLRADIYALGATVFHMLTGKPPFVGKTIGQVLAAKLKDDQSWVEKLPSGTSNGTVELLKEMLAQDPEERISNYTTLLNRINTLLAQPMVANEISNAETIVKALDTDESLGLLLQSSATSTSTSSKRRVPWLIGASLLLIILGSAGFYFADSFGERPEIPVSQLAPSGWERAFFNGTDLNGWTAIRGGWGPTVDDMGSKILAGKGSIVRKLPRKSNSPEEPLPNFGIRLKVDLHSAEAAELHFEHEDIRDDALPRQVVRMTSEGVLLGHKLGKATEFLPSSSTYPWTPSETDSEASKSHYHELRLERHKTHWLVLLDSKPTCHHELQLDHPPQVIQLVVKGGQAHFADLFIFELARSKSSNEN